MEWIDIDSSIDKVTELTELTEDYAIEPTPHGFNNNEYTITLYPYQSAMLHAMLSLEKKRFKRAENISKRGVSEEILIETSSGIVSASFGTGKTIVMLALILAKKIPDLYPNFIKSTPNIRRQANLYHTIYREYSYIITANIVFVGSAVFNQWRKEIGEKTNLKVMTVKNVMDLQRLYNCIRLSTVNSFDVVLVKNGKANIENFNWYGEQPHNYAGKNIANIVDIVGNMTSATCWSRLIIDDFDSIGLPKKFHCINAIFTWFVSTTKTVGGIRAKPRRKYGWKSQLDYDLIKQPEIKYDEPYGKIFDDYVISYPDISKNKLLFGLFNIAPSEDYINKSLAIGMPKFYRCLVRAEHDKDGNYNRLLAGFDGELVDNVREMIEADAIEDAAKLVGVAANSVADIFKKILDDSYEKYIFYGNCLRFIAENQPHLANLPQPLEDETYGRLDLKSFTPIRYNYRGLNAMMNEVRVEMTEMYAEIGKALERVRNNAKDGTCPICKSPFRDDNVVILKCCGCMLCSICATDTTALRKTEDNIVGKCPACRREIGFLSMIFISERIDVSQISDENAINNASETETEAEPACKQWTKYDYIVSIIKNREFEAERIEVNVNGLLKGRGHLSTAKRFKTLIFTNYRASVIKIEQRLVEEHIPFIRLHGTVDQISAQVARYRKSTEVLPMPDTIVLDDNGVLIGAVDDDSAVDVLIITNEHCAGLNLENTNRYIFFHKLLNAEMEAQLLGRAQRIGRKDELEVYYLQNYCEKTSYHKKIEDKNEDEEDKNEDEEDKNDDEEDKNEDEEDKNDDEEDKNEDEEDKNDDEEDKNEDEEDKKGENKDVDYDEKGENEDVNYDDEDKKGENEDEEDEKGENEDVDYDDEDEKGENEDVDYDDEDEEDEEDEEDRNKNDKYKNKVEVNEKDNVEVYHDEDLEFDDSDSD